MTARREPADRGRERATTDAGQLEAELAAERAGTAYWREVAAQRRAEAARVQHRPLVRAAVAIDRRTRAGQDAAARRVRRTAAAGRRAAVTVAGLAGRGGLAERRAQLRRSLDRAAAAAPAVTRPVVVVHLGAAPAHLAEPGAAQWEATGPVGWPAAVEAAVADHPGADVCLLGPSTRTLHEGWLGHLLAALDQGAAMAGATAVHPERPWRESTPHDLLVRWSGLTPELAPDGAPIARALEAGTVPQGAGDPGSVPMAGPSAVVISAAALAASGGLDAALPYDAAILDLSMRLRGMGEVVTSVGAAMVEDDRPVTARTDLEHPLAPRGTTWTAVVDRHGPAIAAEAGAPHPADGLTIALTTATPSPKIAGRSGDWHYAGLVGEALERAGHAVMRQTIAEAEDPVGRACDLRLVLRGLEPVRRSPGQRHVLWIISHPEAVDIAECDEADLVLVASERFAAHLRQRTSTPVEVLLQATDPRHFRPDAGGGQARGVVIVANTRGTQRQAVADAVAAGLRPEIHGQGWAGLVPADLLAADYVDFAELPGLYADAEVVLNDHWETMRAWGFVSNRVFDVLACGTPVVSDQLPELEALFGSLVPTWQGPDDLREVVAAIRADPAATAARTAEARDVVLAHHTFDHRAAELAAHLAFHGLGDAPRSTS